MYVLLQEKISTVSQHMLKTRVTLQNLKTLSYNFPQSDIELASEFSQTLEELYHSFYSRLPNNSGILIRQPDQDSMRSTRRRECRNISTHDCTSLPPCKKARKASKRVGSKADKLRKDLQKSQVHIILCISREEPHPKCK